MIHLDTLKQHCRVEIDDDDKLLLGYRDAAFDWIVRWLGREIVDNEDDLQAISETNPTAMLINQAIINAALLLVSHWYDHRDATTTPTGVTLLLQPYRVMGV